MSRYVIIGAGAAGSVAALEIRKHDPNGEIMLITKEAHSFYHRYDLTRYMAGQIDRDALFHDYPARFEKSGIKLRVSQAVVSIDPDAHCVCLGHREKVPYDRLLLATGVSARVHPRWVPFMEHLTRVSTLTDVEGLMARPEKLKKVLIVGGSLTGLKFGLAVQEMRGQADFLIYSSVTGHLLARPGDKAAVYRFLKQREIRYWNDLVMKQVTMRKGMYQVAFEDGRTAEYGLLVSGMGVLPNIDLAERAGIPCETGILVNNRLQTQSKDIFAAGDAAQIYNPQINDYWINFGWPNAVKQGILAGQNMAGKKAVYKTDAVNLIDLAGSPIKIKSWE